MFIAENRGNSAQPHTCCSSLSDSPHNKLWYRSRRFREQRRDRNTAKRHTIAARFERSLLPALTELFGNMFRNYPDYARDDAVQDCLCQAWLAYSGLPTYTATTITAGRLATRVYRQYRAGGRFAALAG